MRRIIPLLVLAGMAVPVAAQTVQTPPAPPPGAPMPPRMGAGMMGAGMIRADANDDGIVTRAEALADAGARFDRLDANRDGKLDASELAAQRGGRRGMRGGDMPAPSPQ